MILVIGGTRDGRELAGALADEGWQVLLSTATDYGRDLAARPGIAVRHGMLDAAGWAALIGRQDIRMVVDASHPYAAAVSANVAEACRKVGISCLRYERPSAPIPAGAAVRRVPDAGAAARLSAELGQTVFLTVGSRTLAVFRGEPALAGHRLVARVLPQADVLTACAALGFTPRDIVALQGPFSHELNLALFREYAADVVVTKDSGEVGGTDSKITAAAELGLPLIVIDRPQSVCPTVAGSFAAVVEEVKEALK